MGSAGHVSCNVCNATTGKDHKLRSDRREVGDLELVVNVDLENLAANRRKNVRVSVIGNVRPAALKLAFLKARLHSSVVVTPVVENGWIVKRQQFGPNPRPRFRKSSAHRRVYRPC